MTANIGSMGLDRPEVVLAALKVIDGTVQDDIGMVSRAVTELGAQFNLSELERVEVALLGVAGLAVELLKTLPDWEAKLRDWQIGADVDVVGMPPLDDVLGDRVAEDAGAESPDVPEPDENGEAR